MAQEAEHCYPAVHSILNAADLGRLVLRDFGLPATQKIRLIQSGLNDHYALRSGDSAYVIRVYRSGSRSKQDITWELDLINHLVRCGAPVAGGVRRLDGEWFSEVEAIEGRRQVAVFQRAPGRYTHFGSSSGSRISPADCAAQFGRSLAELHAAADSYQPVTQRFCLDAAHLLDQPLEAIADQYQYRPRDIDELREMAGQLRRILEARRAHLDWGPCHGDVSGGNSTYWRGQVIHFDFDCAGPGWRAYDLGVFFWSLSINGHGAEAWDTFLQGYHSYRTLPTADAEMIAVFAAARVIWLMGLWCANAGLFGAARLHDDYFDRELRHLRYFCGRATSPTTRSSAGE